MARITLYTTAPCARCGKAKVLLSQRGIEFEEVNLSKDPVGRAELARRTGLMTFPQITVGGQTLGGLDDLRAADQDGRLAELLSGES
ncbi:MAG: glutaredoxin domain-containing protein [Solirubrobacteraceae bacterium]|jgi:glutaredoxin 3